MSEDKKAAEQAVATTKAAPPPAVYDYGEHGGAGFEDTKGSDLSIPFIAILQALSPQVENKDPEGSEPGKLFNTVTRELFDGDKGIVFQPVHKEYAFVEWVPRNKGGGFVAMHDPEGDVVAKAIENNDGRKFGGDGLHVGENDLVETYYVYGLILDDAGAETQGFAVISFTSTKIKPYRDWLTSMYTLKGQPPMFANRARFRSIKQKSDNGPFFNFRIDPLRETWAASLVNPQSEAGLLEEAVSFRDLVLGGMVRASFETQNATSGGDATGGGTDSPDVPF